MEITSYNDPKSVVAEAFKVLRTNLKFTNVGGGVETILVTSSLPGEGKSWVSGNLAVIYTQAGKRVVIVDSDMRKGRQHNIFHVDNTNGLSNFLAGIYSDDSTENVKDLINDIPGDDTAFIKRIEVLKSIEKIAHLRDFLSYNFRLEFQQDTISEVFSSLKKWKMTINKYPNLQNYFSNNSNNTDIKLCNIEAKEFLVDLLHDITNIKKNNAINDINNYVKKTAIEDLYLLPPGSVPPNPSELLDSKRLVFLIEKLKESFDVIIFDGTPCQLVADSLIVARHVDSVLLMAVYGESKMEIVNKTKKDIEKAGAKIAGIVLNKVPNKKGYYGYYGYSAEKKIKVPAYKRLINRITSGL